jgi:carboxyl-terminal processing protease
VRSAQGLTALLYLAAFAVTPARAQLNTPQLSTPQLNTPINPRQKQLQIDSFETVWTTVRDKHWDPRPGGLDWQAIHEEYRPLIDAATGDDQARAIVRAMLARLKETHFAIFAPGLAEEIANDEGDGTPGFEVRVLDAHVVITDVYPGSPVHAGWEVLNAGKWEMPNLVEKLHADAAINEYALERAVQSRLTGTVGASKHFVFLDGSGERVGLDLKLQTPRGELAGFGNLPPQRVWFAFHKIENTGFIRLTEFLDLPRVIPAFGKAIQDCAKCEGLIIDLRGNPGGIGGMAMGMAGWLTERQDQQLGTMYMRGATLKFLINPRADAYTGPVAILVDGTSASTSEILAGGLQDLHRARIFGTRTAGAALPSVITRLPNGDGFQYAVANYISEGGLPLEGNGVTPDVEVRLTRASLLAERDAVADAALEWIRQQRKRP